MVERDYEGEIEEKAKEIKDLLSTNTVDEAESTSMVIQIGSEVYELKPTGKTSNNVEEIIKTEMKEKITQKLKNMGDAISNKVNEITEISNGYKRNLLQKINEYDEKMNNIIPMPNIEIGHGEKGLSVIRGTHPGNLVYLVRGIYWPKTITFDKSDLFDTGEGNGEYTIKPSLSRKMMVPVMFYIEVDRHLKIVEISTRKLMNLDYFPHYHQQNGEGDCWGTWESPGLCRTPEEAINIAKKAESILENIYTYSLTTENPNGLPDVEYVKKNIMSVKEHPTPARAKRMGVDERETSNEPVWEI